MNLEVPIASGSKPARTVINIPETSYDTALQPAFKYSSLADNQTSICIDNGSHSWRAGFSSMREPYVDRTNIIAKYKERKNQRNIMLFGKDTEADANSRSNARPMFDGDLLVNGDILEGALDYTFLTLGISTDRINHPIVMSERLANPVFTRAMTSEILFELYNVPSVTYGVDSLFAFSRQKHQDGLAVNMGNNSTTIIPILDGKGILSKSKRIPWGGSQAAETMLKLAQLKYPNFPTKVTPAQATFMTRETCYFSSDYNFELKSLADPALMSNMTQIIQFPYTQTEIAEKTEAELAAQSEKRKEQGKRLQEMQARQRAEKLLEKTALLEDYKALSARRSELSSEQFLNLVSSETDFESPNELESWIKKTESDIKRKQKKDAGEDIEVEEEPTFPLVDRPDDELNEQELREKKKQRLMKAGWEARVKIREEKKRERERIEQGRRKEDEERRVDPEGWARRLREEQQAVILRMEERKKQKTQRKDRKSVAAQNRMKTIANLAAEEKVPKKRKKGDDDDGFGRDDADWMVYREVGDDGESEAEEDDLSNLQSIETRLLQHDPSFTEDETMMGRAQVKNALINSFVHGGLQDRFNPDDLKHTHQLHLNVERIRVPESWFQPGMFGVDSGGVGEIAGWILNNFEEEQRRRMMQCIFVTGGSSKFPNFIPRLRNALTPVLPFRAPLKIVSSLHGSDARLEAWKGMAEWSITEEAKKARVTRAEYDEFGGEYVKEYAWGNPPV